MSNAGVDRGDATNLARNILNGFHKPNHITARGIRVLAEAVMAMDAALASQPAPAVVGSVQFKGGMTVTDQSRELDAGFAAQDYCRSKWGAARGHAEWRRYHDAFVAGYLAVPQPQQIAEPASQWIGVNERLPVWVVRDDTPCFINGKELPPTLFSETVLVALKGGGVRTDKLTTIEGKSEGWWHTYGERVAAWMLAPKPPTQKDPS